MDESDREEETVTRYCVPDYAREILCAFHGGSLLLACYLLEDTFFIPGTLPLLLLGSGVILLILTFLMDSLSLSVACVLAATAAAVTGGHDWIVTASWGLMAALVPFLLTLLKNDRQYSLIVLSWCWTAGVLFLISRTTNMLWEMMFFSEAAAFTWIIGSMMRSYTAAGMAVRFLGSTAMFGVLGISSFGQLWIASLSQESGWLLWGAFGLLLLLNLYVLMKALQKREWRLPVWCRYPCWVRRSFPCGIHPGRPPAWLSLLLQWFFHWVSYCVGFRPDGAGRGCLDLSCFLS